MLMAVKWITMTIIKKMNLEIVTFPHIDFSVIATRRGNRDIMIRLLLPIRSTRNYIDWHVLIHEKWIDLSVWYPINDCTKMGFPNYFVVWRFFHHNLQWVYSWSDRSKIEIIRKERSPGRLAFRNMVIMEIRNDVVNWWYWYPYCRPVYIFSVKWVQATFLSVSLNWPAGPSETKSGWGRGVVLMLPVDNVIPNFHDDHVPETKQTRRSFLSYLLFLF